jgi:hypothetical protein
MANGASQVGGGARQTFCAQERPVPHVPPVQQGCDAPPQVPPVARQAPEMHESPLSQTFEAQQDVPEVPQGAVAEPPPEQAIRAATQASATRLVTSLIGPLSSPETSARFTPRYCLCHSM